MLKTIIKTRLSAFWEDTRGSVSVEFVLAMPILFWAFLASYVFFDGYRQSAVNLRAAYTIADLISRETEPLTPDFMESMRKLHVLLTRDFSHKNNLRVTIVRWDEDDDRYYRDWSKAKGAGVVPLTDADLLNLETKLPTMPDAERVIVVETTNNFTPVFNVGLEEMALKNFVFTRPRFAPLVTWSDS